MSNWTEAQREALAREVYATEKALQKGINLGVMSYPEAIQIFLTYFDFEIREQAKERAEREEAHTA